MKGSLGRGGEVALSKKKLLTKFLVTLTRKSRGLLCIRDYLCCLGSGIGGKRLRLWIKQTAFVTFTHPTGRKEHQKAKGEDKENSETAKREKGREGIQA